MSKKPPAKVKANQVAPKVALNSNTKKPTNAKNVAPAAAKPAAKVSAAPEAAKRPPSAPKPPPLTELEIKQHKSATVIQCTWRKYKARHTLLKLKVEKKELDEKLSRLEQDAFIQLVKIEQVGIN